MKSLQTIKQDTRLSDKQLLHAFRDCLSYFLSDDELEPFLIKEMEKKLNTSKSNFIKLKGGKEK